MPTIPITRSNCRLSEPDGILVSHGSATWPAHSAGAEVLLSDLDQPGQLIRRCLLGPLRQVVLHLSDGRHLQAVVERVRFDRRLGRVCVLRLGLAGASRDCRPTPAPAITATRAPNRPWQSVSQHRQPDALCLSALAPAVVFPSSRAPSAALPPAHHADGRPATPEQGATQ